MYDNDKKIALNQILKNMPNIKNNCLIFFLISLYK